MVQTYTPEKARFGLWSKLSHADMGLRIAAFLLLLGSVFIALEQQNPTRAVAPSAPLTEFSSGRAMEKLRSISQRPHPVGSAEHAAVRDYIVRELTAIGLRPEIQKTTVISQGNNNFFRAATVENIVARLSGTASSKAVVLAAHYDSVPTSFGASDDGSGVAAILETARALRAGPPLKNDSIFLITDCEEVGLLGAKAFVEEHPLAKAGGLVFNFEARGNGGPSIMFETSNENGVLIAEFASAAPVPIANSLASEIYKHLPNDTDMSVFKKAGFSGLNFAFIRGLSHYHTQLDSFAEIDERSLQHQGSYALALARHFGNLDLRNMKGGDRVYFNIPGPYLIHYSQRWIPALTVLSALLFACALLYGLKKGRFTISGVMKGVVALLLCLLGAPLLSWGIWSIISYARQGYSTAPWAAPYQVDLYFLGFVAVNGAFTFAVYNWFSKSSSIEDLSMGALLWWVILMTLSAHYLPSGSYLLMWPLLFSLAGLIMTRLVSAPGPSWMSYLVLVLCALPGIFLVAPLVYHLASALTVHQAPWIMIPLVLLLSLLLPHHQLLSRSRTYLLPVGLGVAGVLLLAYAVWANGFDGRHPQTDTLFYGLDADKGLAYWASTDEASDVWTAQFFPAPAEKSVLTFYPIISREFRWGPAAVAPLPAPQAALLSDDRNGNHRSLRLHISSPRQAPLLAVYVDAHTPLDAAFINGKPVNLNAGAAVYEQGEMWGMRYYALPLEGFDLTLETISSQPVKVRVEDQSYGLPNIPGAPYQPRPANIMPAPSPFSDLTVVGKSYTF
jgi:hypothetical protein